MTLTKAGQGWGVERFGSFVLAALALGCASETATAGAQSLGRSSAAAVPGATNGAAFAANTAPAACAAPVLPAPEALTAENPKLHDPFTTLTGTRIKRRAEWACRRAEIAAQLEHYELGPKPPRPAVLRGEAAEGQITVTAGDGDKSISFTASITLPATGTAPFPAIIAMGKSGLNDAELSKLGVAVIRFPNNELAAQQNAQSRGQGLFYELYGKEHGAGAMMAWAWGISRLIDALEATPGAQIDPERLGVTGCSRNGKGALVAGAFDERIQLTIPQESGAGGSASWRVSEWQRAEWVAAGSPSDPVSQDVQTLRQIVQENVWFRTSFAAFSERVDALPFDHHMAMGLVAPRALLVIENTSMHWLGKISTFTASAVAHRIWEALGVPDRMAYSQLGGHDHCVFPAAQQPLLTAYVNEFLSGGASGAFETNVLETDGGYTLDEARWVDWRTPDLAP